MEVRGQRQRAAGKGDYPANWAEIAKGIKDAAGWHCGHPHETSTSRAPCDASCTHPKDGKQRMLTMHHLYMDPANCAEHNLVALCQACHLRVQSKIDPQQIRLGGDLRKEPDWLRRRPRVMLAANGGSSGGDRRNGIGCEKDLSKMPFSVEIYYRGTV